MSNNKEIILPEWSECQSAFAAGTATPLTEFIRANEPAGYESQVWRTELLNVLTTIRQEERRAALRDCIGELCIDCAEGEVPTFDEKARWYYHYAGTGGEVGCSASKLRIRADALEAAANETREDGDDG